jgi:peptidoglycan/xylan/chitin deacetylase (PgdA/CDA1 family)
MTQHVARRAAVLAGWDDLRLELDTWEEMGATATFWWRDDDAVAASPALDRLLALADGVPLGLAVIPARAEKSLAAAIANDPGAAILQHGWAHANHAADGAKKAELGADRLVAEVVAELRQGRRRLEDLFGARFIPVVVPPWNRVAREILPEIRDAGFAGVSTHGDRPADSESAGLRWANVHVDLMDWEAGAFAGTSRALGQVVSHLAARRTGTVDREEPTGIMSHHLVHGGAAETFLERLFGELRSHPAASILSPVEAFA